MRATAVWISLALALLVALVGIRHLFERRARRRRRALQIDDDAIERILAHGTLTIAEEEEPLDDDEIARAEEEFWEESWDEPEEYGR